MRRIPQLVFLKEHWKDYHRHVHKNHVSTTSLWRFHGGAIRDSYLDLMSIVMEPGAYVTLQALTRLQDVKRQRYLERIGILGKSDILDQLSDDQISKFIDLAYKRLQRILHPRFQTRLIHWLLYNLGLFTYNGDVEKLSREEAFTLALSGAVSWSHRKLFRKYSCTSPVRHPMVKVTCGELVRKVAHYFAGGRIFLWLSDIVYWRYWRDFRRARDTLRQGNSTCGVR